MKSCEELVEHSSDYYIYSPSLMGRETFLYPLQVGHFKYKPGYHQNRTSYDSFLLMYIQSGSLTVTIDGIDYNVHAKQFVLIDCYKPHGYHSANGWEALWLHFDGLTARSYYNQILDCHGNIFSIPDSYSSIEKFQLIYDSFAKGKNIREALIGKYLIDILTDFLLQTTPAEHTPDYTALIGRVVSYISEHLSEELTVDELAGSISLSTYHFIRVFKRETGFTPHEYIINSRMNAARYLLSSTSMSLREICDQTGFSCESIFCSAFKKCNGMTPTEYRKTGDSTFID